MVKAAVIGDPIQHSLSPDIFGFLARERPTIELNYEARNISSLDLEKFLQTVLAEKSWIGLNVTIPHKESVLKFAKQISDSVRIIGAANVLQFKEQEIYAYNTDVIGIQESLNRAAVPLAEASVLILGAGGAARAAIYACASMGASEIKILNRTVSRAQSLVQEFKNAFGKIDFSVVSENLNSWQPDLIIQTTSVGMSTGASDLTYENLYKEIFKNAKKKAVAFDLVYRPESTLFLKKASTQGLAVIGGLWMLIEQALATWEIWFGPIPDKSILSEKLQFFLRERLRAHP